MGRYMQAALQNVGRSKKKEKNYKGARSEKRPRKRIRSTLFARCHF
jgi:hypothetical protein